MTPEHQLPVVSHVDPAVLLGPVQSKTSAYSRMVDGRTAYQQILFVEPRLLQNNPDHAKSKGNRTRAASVFVPPLSAQLRGNYAPKLPVTEAQLGLLNARELTHGIRAEGIMQETGLSLFLKLASSEFSEPVVHAMDAREAARVLTQVAFDLLVLWVRAETHDAAIFSRPLPATARRFLEQRGDVFAASVLAEFCARLGLEEAATRTAANIKKVYVGSATLHQTFGTGSDFPLCRELIAYWLPLWNRHCVIFNSPFDLMSDLETFA